MKRVIKACLALAAILIIGGSGIERKTIPYPAALKDAGVTLSDLKNGQRQGLILGNGDLYGIVMEKEGRLFMRITKNDIWDARMDLSGDGEMPKVDIANNKISGPDGGPPSYGKLFPQPRCAAGLVLGTVPLSSYTAHLDIEKAAVTVEQVNEEDRNNPIWNESVDK